MTTETILEQARVTPSDQLPEFLGKLETARAVAYSRLSAPATSVRPNDELLSIEAASARLGVSKGYLYRHHNEFSFARRIGKRLLFSASGIEAYINEKGANRK
jgi:predicted DNA-binding transcriptional regulator AlpA